MSRLLAENAHLTGSRAFLERAPHWNYIMAVSVFAVAPVIILFFFAQRYFIQGIVFTGIKG